MDEGVPSGATVEPEQPPVFATPANPQNAEFGRAKPAPTTRWRIRRAPRASFVPAATKQTRSPLMGTPRMLVDRILVQCAAGEELEAVLPHVDQEISGLVLNAGRLQSTGLREVITRLPERGFTAPVTFDPEGYRKHVASVGSPFHLPKQGLFGETLDDALSRQIKLGAAVAMTPMGYTRIDALDALETAAEQANALDRTDFLFTVPLDAMILENATAVQRVIGIIQRVKAPAAVILGAQFDPFDQEAEIRITAMRSLVAASTHVAAIRTDFNGFDLLAHGAFAAAIGVGGQKRHAVHPNESSHSFDPTDPSPSVLYPRLLSFWRGSKIYAKHGRLRPPSCECQPCAGASLGRFLTKTDTDQARAHGVAVWQEWARLMLSNEDPPARARFWKNRCQAAVDEHGLLSIQARRKKPFTPRPALKAWAKLPA